MPKATLTLPPRSILAAVMLFTLTLAPASQAKFDPVDALAGQMLGQSIGNAINSVNEGVQGIVEGIVEFNHEISKARQRFFALYPDGEGLEEAADEFTRILFAKDLTYLTFHADPDFRDKDTQAMKQLSRAITETIDGGIPELAYPSFYDLKMAMRKELGNRLPSLQGYLNAMKKCEKEWAAYTVIRNCAEFRAAGLEYPAIKSPEGYVYFIAQLYGSDQHAGRRLNPEEIENAYTTLVSMYGEDLVNDIVARVRRAPKNKLEILTDIESLGLIKTQRIENGYNNTPAPQGKTIIRSSNPWSVITGLILDHSDENYAIYYLRNHYDRSVQVYGKERVHQAANKARNAPKRMEDGRLLERQGRHPMLIFSFIKRDLLSSGDLKNHVLYLLNNIEGENARELAEEAYQELAAIKGEEALLEAATRLQEQGWDPRKAGVKSSRVKTGLRQMLVGVEINNENYVRWAKFLPYSSVTYEVDIMEPGSPGKTQLNEVFLNGCSETTVFLKYRTVYLRNNNKRAEGEASTLKLEPYADYDQTSFIPRDWVPVGPRTEVLGKETIDVLGKKLTCMKVLHNNKDLNFSAEVWLSDQIPGGVAKAVMSGTHPGFFTRHTFTIEQYEAVLNDKFAVPDWFDLTGLKELQAASPPPTAEETAEEQKQREEKMNRRRGRLQGR
jgi:hypothetical protein